MNTIVLKAVELRHEELVAAAAITPGHLVYVDTNGKAAVHATEGGYAERIVACEDALQGKTISDAYSAADIVSLHNAVPGDTVQMFLKAGENVAIGATLVSAGDGTLIDEGSVSSGVTVKQPIAKILEAKDLSASGAVDTLVTVRVL